jgi:hypothetical protein
MILRLILGDQLNPKLQRNYRGLDFLEADFSIVRLGMRYKI